ncbi:MAG: DoxX family protein [Steroidobacteraceae bacterium]
MNDRPSSTRKFPALASALRRFDVALSYLASPFLLATRLYVSWQFLTSGWLKISTWQTTLALFTNEYHVPVLPPHVAAVVGTFGELFFPVLLILGLFSRPAAIGLSVVNAMAVISYAHVLLADGNEAALGQHVLWGFMLLAIMVFGSGALSIDGLFARGKERAEIDGMLPREV